MRWTIVPIGIATAFFSLTTNVLAQTEQRSSAELLGIQERSLELQEQSSGQNVTKAEPANTTLAGSRTHHALVNDQFVLYRIDRNTRVVMGPAINTVKPDVFSGNAFLGDNRLQLLHDLDP